MSSNAFPQIEAEYIKSLERRDFDMNYGSTNRETRTKPVEVDITGNSASDQASVIPAPDAGVTPPTVVELLRAPQSEGAANHLDEIREALYEHDQEEIAAYKRRRIAEQLAQEKLA